MLIEFTKMHGLGNDFMVIDLVTQRMTLTPELIRLLADRRIGVGFDQLLIVEPPSRPDIDFKYRILMQMVLRCPNVETVLDVLLHLYKPENYLLSSVYELKPQAVSSS